MINSLITSIIITAALANGRLDKSDHQLHNLAKEIYLLLPQDELDFLSNNVSGFVINWLVEKHGKEFNKKIEKKIANSIISSIQSNYELRSINNITSKQLLVFAYVAQMIINKNNGLENAALLAISHIKTLNSINTSPKITINNDCHDIIIEKQVMKQLDTINNKIMLTLSKNERVFLSEISDTFILVWFFTNKWARPLSKQNNELQEIFADENFINNETIKYIIHRYKLNINWINEFKVFLTGAYFAGKLKANNSDLETCLQIFLTYQFVTMPKPESAYAEEMQSKTVLGIAK
jgi:hypothetical protein